MTANIGYGALLLAFLFALWGIIAPVLGSWGFSTEKRRFLPSVRAAILGQFILVTIASSTLIYALVTTDFSIKYVV
ncbi:MAG: hypothetical protein V3W08_02480, partial [Candidatus Binatia bacterium]